MHRQVQTRNFEIPGSLVSLAPRKDSQIKAAQQRGFFA
jgi:hypothetical protein